MLVLLPTMKETASLDITRTLFNEVQSGLSAQHLSILARDQDLTLWSYHASGWFTHLRSHGVPRGVGLSWVVLKQRQLQIFRNPSKHPQVFSPVPNLSPTQTQVSIPFFDSHHQPLGVLHLLHEPPNEPFETTELDWLEERIKQIAPHLEQALNAEQALNQSLKQNTTTTLIQQFAQYLGEPQPIANAIAWAAAHLECNKPPESLPLETKQAIQQFKQRFDAAPLAQSTRILQVVIAYQQATQRTDPDHAIAWLRREAGWKLDPLLVHAFEQFLAREETAVA